MTTQAVSNIINATAISLAFDSLKLIIKKLNFSFVFLEESRLSRELVANLLLVD